jgi:hypothetical protein
MLTGENELSNVNLKHFRSKGPAGGSTDFLGDPPPGPRFLASLGALDPVPEGAGPHERTP